MDTIRTIIDRLTSLRRADGEGQDPHRWQRGQVLPLFVVLSVVLIAGAALVTDAAWWWTMEQKAKRAADAGALAGAVYLPAQPSLAQQAAIDEARKNGFEHGVDGVVVTPVQDEHNVRKLIVDIDAPVDTFFAKVVAINTVNLSVSGSAEYTLPVPMGSPENYYGVFGALRGLGNTTPAVVPSTAPSGSWGYTGASTMVEAVMYDDVDTYARTSTNNARHVFGGFGLLDALPTPGAGDPLGVTGIEVLLNDTRLSNWCNNSVIQAHLSWDGGASWTDPPSPNDLNDTRNLDRELRDVQIGSSSNTQAFPIPGGRTWVRDDLSDANFRLRLTATNRCGSYTQFRVDQIRVRVNAEWVSDEVMLEGPGTGCANGLDDCFNPDGAELNPRGFWATMNTRGAENVNGDAHQPKYINPTWNDAPECAEPEAEGNACYDPDTFYNYAVEMAPGSTGGYVYVFDPGFCDTDKDRGVGDRWFRDSDAVSTWYELFDDVNNTPYDYGDDSLVASSEDLFEEMDADDSTMGGSGGAECMRRNTSYGPPGSPDGRDYHLSWYLLNPDDPLNGGPAAGSGKVYRLHTTGTDPDGDLLSDANGEQSFALYAGVGSGDAPRVYGLGAMQMFTPLSSDGNGVEESEFYLAQIEAAHAGKTVELKLWDPGDTQRLRAWLEILIPQNGGGWSATTDMNYWAKAGTTHNSVNTNCNSNTGESVSSILTNQGGNVTGEFNGCWLTIHIPIPEEYEADEDGWWKIRYNMTGAGASNDVTTWKVAVIGNPVHLVP